VLVAVTAVLAVGLAGVYGYQRFLADPLAKRTEERAKAQQLSRESEQDLRAARRDAAKLDEAARLCLPQDPVKARERYQAYLLGLLRSAEIATPTVTPSNPRRQRNGAILVVFTVSADTDIYSLVKFLHGFYLEPRLHQITNLTLTPLEARDIGPTLRVSMNIEAVGLGAGEQPSRGHEAPFTPPVAVNRDAYGVVVEKNILYAAGPGSSVLRANDPEHVRLVSIIDPGGESVEADLYDRAQNVTRRVRAGDECTIGRTKAVLLDIAPDIVMSIDGNLYLWKLGTFFSERTPISAEDALAREVLKSRQKQRAGGRE
jgi:hypothetical protein